MNEPTDAELMARAQRGELEGFTLLVDRHKDGLVSYLARLVSSRERAEDLAQESFLRLYRSARSAGRYREEGSFRAFLYRIATNLVRSEERQRRRQRLLAPLLAAGNGHAGEPPPEARALAAEARRQVTAALVELPLRYRVPVVLHEIEGWPYAAIARLVGCREGTVKSRIHRGRQRLRESLESYWNGWNGWNGCNGNQGDPS